ncbi:MAG: hypothetical protein ABSG25_00040 [Bryobacteraceae bacterium]
MKILKSNPNRFYLVMIFVILMSFVTFLIGPRLGYPASQIHECAILIAIWAPTLGILGLRAELMNKKQD